MPLPSMRLESGGRVSAMDKTRIGILWRKTQLKRSGRFASWRDSCWGGSGLTKRVTEFSFDELYWSIEAIGVEEGLGPPLDRLSDY
jgi:hypothetical protein